MSENAAEFKGTERNFCKIFAKVFRLGVNFCVDCMEIARRRHLHHGEADQQIPLYACQKAGYGKMDAENIQANIR